MTKPTNQDVMPMWPVDAPEDYVRARIEIAEAERALRDQVEAVAEARRRLPVGAELAHYELAEGPADPGLDEPVRTTPLPEVFGEHDSLVVYHLMFGPDDKQACPMCSMWVDGFHGVSRHIARHAAFAVVAKATVPALRSWARRRGWDGLRLLSSHGTTFNRDLNVEYPDGAQRPAISVLVREGSTVRHFFTLPANYLDDTQRGIDSLSPVWNLLDLLPAGRGDWFPDNSYAGRSRG